jgi:class 3 adenylate cyclase
MSMPLAGRADIPEFNDSVKNEYFRLEQEGAFQEAAELALDIGHHFSKNGDHDQARKYYEYAYTNSKKDKLFGLGGRSAFKLAMTLIAMSESGKYGLEQEQEYYEGAMQWFKWADELFDKSNLVESYEHQLTLIEMGEMEHFRGEYSNSKKNLDEALKYAQKHKNFELAFRAVELLIDNCERTKEYRSELPYYQSIYDHFNEFFQSKDSLTRQMDTIMVLKNQSQQQMAALEEKEEVLQLKQVQLDQQLMLAQEQQKTLEEQRKNEQYMVIIIATIFGLLILALFSYISIRRSKKKLEMQNRQILEQKAIIEKRQKELSAEKAKTDRLLLNILPRPVAEELKATGKVMPRPYKHVSVLFSDFKGFTSIASRMPAPKMIHELEVCFSAFDKIIHKYKLEKIKTIGDGYMCAGGVPIANNSNPQDTVWAAMEMIDFMRKRKEEKILKNEPFFEIRIGINTGPVIAGIVGEKKFAYDIWGDTVNLASRLETSGKEWKINISENTYRHVKDHFFFTYRGKIDAKNKGEVDMYFVDGRVRYSKKQTG